MCTASLFTPGRVLMIVGNILTAVGPFMADWNQTHIYNPRWPPHAKFHNGQTMTLGVLLATASTYFVKLSADATNRADEVHNLWLATMIGSFYYGAGLSAIFYPGTAFMDPEFKRADRKIHQGHVFSVFVGLMWVAYGIEMWRMG